MINHSEQINEISLALSKAQSQMTHAHKSKENPVWKSKYAPLESLIECAKGPLGANDLAVVQGSYLLEGNLVVTTKLLHKSGQWLETSVTMKPKDLLPQSIGSALTYGKRYGYSLITGIASDDDDDGNAADSNAQQKKQPPRDDKKEWYDQKFDKNSERWLKALSSVGEKYHLTQEMMAAIAVRLQGQPFKNVHNLIAQAKVEMQ